MGQEDQSQREEILWESGAVPVADDGSWVSQLALREARKPFAEFNVCTTARNGENRYISLSGEAVIDASGRFSGYCGIARDVTASKRSELLLMLEHSVARSLASASDSSETLLRCRHPELGIVAPAQFIT